MTPQAPISPLAPLTWQLRKRLQDIYETLDRALERMGAACRGCGDCCHLERYGHQVWLTSLELAYLLDCHPLPPEAGTKDGVCPYLREELCSARRGRTVSCRVFHCDADDDRLAEVYEEALASIRALADQLDLQLEYGELLSSLRAQRGQTDQISG